MIPISLIKMNHKPLFISFFLLFFLPTSHANNFSSVQGDISGTLIRLLPDTKRPYVYGIQRDNSQSSITFVNSNTDTIEKTLAIDDNACDFAIDATGDILYVIHFRTDLVTQIDLNTFSSLGTFSFPSPSNYSDSSHYDLAIGRLDRLYYTDGQWAPLLHVLDLTSQTEIGLFDFEGIGGLTFTGNGNRMFAWRQKGWGAGDQLSWIASIDTSTDTPIFREKSLVPLDRDPLDSPILLNSQETRLFCKQYSLSPNDLQHPITTFPENIYGITSRGEIVFGDRHAYDAETGRELFTFPDRSSVMAVSGDQQKLYLWIWPRWDAAKQFLVIRTSEIAPVSSPGLYPIPPNTSTVSMDTNVLRWDIQPRTTAYDIYFGLDQTEVLQADRTSPSFQGTNTTNSLILNHFLMPGATYFWRVDKIGSGNTQHKGEVLSFTVAPLIIHPNSLQLAAAVDSQPFETQFSVETLTEHQAWSINANASWISLKAHQGVGSTSVTMTIDPKGLVQNNYASNLEISSNNTTLTLPIKLNVIEPVLDHMLADPVRPFIYGLQRGDSHSLFSYLLRIQTNTALIDRAIPIARGAVDLDMDNEGKTIYVIHQDIDSITRVNAEIFGVIDNFQIQIPTVPDGSNNSVFKGDHLHVTVGRDNRLYFVDGKWDPRIHVVNLDTKSEIGVFNFGGTGDLAISHDGNVLYQWFQFGWDTGSINSRVSQIDSSGDNLQLSHDSSFALSRDPLDSPILLANQDTRLFCKQRVFAVNNLNNPIRTLDEEIYAVTKDGAIAIGNVNAFDVESGQSLFHLPVSTKVMAISSDQRWLYLSANGSLVRVSLFEIQAKPEPTLEVFFPQGDPLLISETYTQIGWRSNVNTAGTAVSIELASTSGYSVNLGVDWDSDGESVRSYYIPLVPTRDDYYVRARSLWDTSLQAESEMLSITGNGVRIYYPNGGEMLKADADVFIHWASNPFFSGTACHFELWSGPVKALDLGDAWDPDGEGLAVFRIPLIESANDYRIRAVSLWDDTYIDRSDASFSIMGFSSDKTAVRASDWSIYQ